MKAMMIIATIFCLAACAPSQNSSSATLPTPSPEGSVITDDTGGDNGDVTGDIGMGFGFNDLPNTPFAALVTGATEITITGDGAFACENGVYVIRSSAGDFPQVSLILPSNASAAQFELGINQGNGSNASAALFLADGRVFAGGIDGLLIVGSLASAPTELVSGSFVFNANNGGDVVEVQGQFNFVASPETVFCGE